MRHELREWKIDYLPIWGSREMSPVGLPRADIIRRAEMDRVTLAISVNDETDTRVVGCIEGAV